MNEKNRKRTHRSEVTTDSPIIELMVNGHPIDKKTISKKIFTIGRISGNDFVIDFMSVSRHHAQIEKIDRDYFIQDLDSRYGTYVNNEKITKHLLSHMDRIRLGNQQDIVLTFHANLPKSAQKRISDTESNFLPFSRQTFQKLNLLLEVLQTTQLSLNLKVILDEIIRSVIKLTKADRGYILLKDDRGDLALKVSRFQNEEAEHRSTEISWGVVNSVLESGQPRVVGDVQTDHELKLHDSILELKIQSIMCIPLRRTNISEEDETDLRQTLALRKDTIGVIYVDSKQINKIYTLDDVKILQTLAGYASSAISNARLFQHEREKTRQLSNAYVDTVRVLANAIEARDIYTRGHTERVAAMAVILARELDWSDEQIFNLKMGAYLHDIGKIGVPDSILNKAANLDTGEYSVMKRHPQIGAKIIQGIASLESVKPYLLYHQERYDGSGYPDGLKGKSIPIEGRLLAVVDVFDALTSKRPYRGPIPPDTALDMIESEKGKHFDPYIVSVFLKCYRNGKIPEMLKKIEVNQDTGYHLIDDDYGRDH
ncbi:FHA domain-containing protein [bacterium]|nr:FHA domain-containing protein [bacterium]